jgi:diguanylate cyclase (GGDEF)-like protein/PAS domain S-box-containing protein
MPTDRYVLLVDDHAIDAEHFKGALGEEPDSARLEWARTLARALEIVATASPWAIFLKLRLPDSDGLATLETMLSIVPDAQIVVVGRATDEALCKTALTLGARDYVLEDHFDRYAIAQALRHLSTREVAQGELKEHERARVTLDSLGDAVMSVDQFGTVTYLNSVAEQLSGWPGADAVGLSMSEVFRIVDSFTREAAENPLAMAIKLNKAVGLSPNCSLIRRNGDEIAIEDSAAPIHDAHGNVAGAVVVFHDVSRARNVVLEMSRLAQHDALTGLPNRLVLKDRLTQALLLARRHRGHLGVLFIDLDGFKQVNDSLGHLVGDLVLQSVAARLTDCVRKSDTVVRLGGDEFVILLPAITHVPEAVVVAAKILAELRRPLVAGEQTIALTASIGVSTYPDSGDKAETLLECADLAMYRAKEMGRNNIQSFDPSLHRSRPSWTALESQLRGALKRGELRVHYQPKVNLKTGAITSAEALVRWQHPERGLLFPSDFLNAARHSGLIGAVDQWVRREACRQTHEWIASGLPAVPISVNVAPVQAQGDVFRDGVIADLNDANVSPRYLELELTETSFLQEFEAMGEALGDVRALGVRLAIDDFGTGCSSLSQLAHLPVDTLKIDRSFVSNLDSTPNSAIVIKAVIAMAKGLHLRVVAEGIETSEQLAFLQSQGCDEGQGYYFSRPIPAQDFVQLLDAGVGCRVS